MLVFNFPCRGQQVDTGAAGSAFVLHLPGQRRRWRRPSTSTVPQKKSLRLNVVLLCWCLASHETLTFLTFAQHELDEL